MFMPKIVVMYVLAVVGGAVYLTRFPESRFPGRSFDLAYMFIKIL